LIDDSLLQFGAVQQPKQKLDGITNDDW